MASASQVAPENALGIHVSMADRGWIVTVERGGRALVTEQYTDWHRVERRVAILSSNLTVPLLSVTRLRCC